jgi:hypothetical protein
MKMIRTQTTLKKIPKEDDSFVRAPEAERVSFMWELTAELWSLKGAEYVERRLPRHVTHLTRLLSKEDLIKNKRSTGREKDKLDAEYLSGNQDV